MDFDEALDDGESLEPIEAYCVHCRESVEMEHPVAVWTRRRLPATRGECPICGGTVFRMGRSAAHAGVAAPEPSARQRVSIKLTRETVYLAFTPADSPAAEALAADLERVGVTCWLHEDADADTAWAEGVHPALSACSRMIYLLSALTPLDPVVEAAWRYFRSKNKPIVVAQIDTVAPPDALRRRPRFDLTTRDKAPFRQLLQALADGR